LQPWRARTVRAAAHALELAPGESARLKITSGTILKNISF
jgi:hypothetical protein